MKEWPEEVLDSYLVRMVLPSVGVPICTSYTIKEVSQIMDCSHHTVYRLAKKGMIFVSPNGRIFINELVKYFEYNKYLR